MLPEDGHIYSLYLPCVLCSAFACEPLHCTEPPHWLRSTPPAKIISLHPIWHVGRSPQKGTVTSGGCQKKEYHFADYLMHFEMIYSHFCQNQTILGLSDVQNKFAPLSFYVCHTNILGFEAFLSSEIWFGLSYSITIAAFCMPNILVYQDQESVHK